MIGMLDHGYSFGGWWTMLLVLVVLALIAYAIYYLATGPSRTKRHSQYRSGRAMELLKERYAGGEITREQFLKMRDELES
jgi:putative membrane protein